MRKKKEKHLIEIWIQELEYWVRMYKELMLCYTTQKTRNK